MGAIAIAALVVIGVPNIGIFSWIILGTIAGATSRIVISRISWERWRSRGERGRKPWLPDFGLQIALGIAGAITGGFSAKYLFGSGLTGLNICSTIVAIAGSIVVLLLYDIAMSHRHA